MEVGTRGNFHAWKLSTFGDGWGVHAPTKQRKIGYPTEKKKGGKKEEGEETRKKNEERNCWTPRERINFTRCGQRKTSGSLKSYLSPFDHDHNLSNESFHRFRIRLISLDYVRTLDATRSISSIENPFSSRKRIRKSRYVHGTISSSSRTSIEKKRKIGYIRSIDGYLVKYFVIIQWGKFKRTMRTTVNHSDKISAAHRALFVDILPV